MLVQILNQVHQNLKKKLSITNNNLREKEGFSFEKQKLVSPFNISLNATKISTI